MTKFFGIGLSRTGSTSLTKGFSMLGYRAIHFPADPATRREYARFFASPSETLTLSLLERYDAVTDTPLACVYSQLDRSYPGSKFVWTVRDKESWLTSCELWWKRSVIPFIERNPAGAMGSFMRLVGSAMYGTAYFDATLFSHTYDTHMAEIPRYFRGREQDLLKLNICAGEGWPELAPFTGSPAPVCSFPHLNEILLDPNGDI